MNRIKLMNKLGKVAKTFPPATKSGKLNKWIVLMKKNQQVSLSSNKGGWLYFDVMCYVDKSSILPIDDLMNKAKQVMRRSGVELTGVETQDFYDTELEAFMNSFEIRIPKEVG